ncbi:hypothetical protein PCE1_000062 [Barthelona sp. PCE]
MDFKKALNKPHADLSTLMGKLTPPQEFFEVLENENRIKKKALDDEIEVILLPKGKKSIPAYLIDDSEEDIFSDISESDSEAENDIPLAEGVTLVPLQPFSDTLSGITMDVPLKERNLGGRDPGKVLNPEFSGNLTVFA